MVPRSFTYSILVKKVRKLYILASVLERQKSNIEISPARRVKDSTQRETMMDVYYNSEDMLREEHMLRYVY